MSPKRPHPTATLPVCLALAALLLPSRALALPGDAAPADAVLPENTRATEAAAPAPAPTAPVEVPRGAEEAPKPKTGVCGTITDAGSGETLIEATVKVVGGGKGVARSDLDGDYHLKVPPGTWELRVYYELYEAQKFGGVVVKQGECTRLDVALRSDSGAIEEVVVEAKADRSNESAALQERRKAAAVSDTISAQEISRTPDSNASDAMKRVVAATVVDGKYVLLRGLGGRYSSTLLNGVTLPSPDPDEQAVPLDLFPTSLLSNLTVAKSYSAELPGTFAGGALQIETRAYPEKLEAKLKVSTGGDSVSLFQDRNAYGGGSFDYFGFSDATRALPDAVPGDQPVRVTRGGLSSAQVEQIGESFLNEWSVGPRRTTPGLGVSANVGDTLRPGGKRLGYVAAFSFSHRETAQRAEVAKVRLADGALQLREQMNSAIGVEGGGVGALLNVGLELDADHQLNLFTLYSHAGDSKAQFVDGFSETDALDVESTRLQMISRGLVFGQLSGRHRLAGLKGLEVKWQGNGSITNRDEPDTRDTAYNVLADGTRRFKNGPGSGERFFSSLEDLGAGGSLDLSLPVAFGSLRAGAVAQRSQRRFGARRFRFVYYGDDASVLLLPPEQLFDARNIGEAFTLEERTLSSDAYDGTFSLLAGYAATDVSLLDPLRIVAGVRYEVASQTLQPNSPFSVTGTRETGTDRTDSDVLPSLNLVYALSDAMNVRAGYSYTLARPQFRELAPFLYFDFARRRSVSGNPLLEETRIHNADLRWEWFAGEGEVFATSVFYKQFINPIEQVIVSASQGDVSFANAPRAQALGVELEARASLGRVAKVLTPLRASANLTLINSEVSFGSAAGGPQTSRERPLEGQSPYVVNAGLSWSGASGTEVAALYNVFGRRIAEVGFDRLPDVYEQPFHRVDVSLSQEVASDFRLRLNVTNLLNQAITLEQGDIAVYRYRPGVAAGLSLEWSL